MGHRTFICFLWPPYVGNPHGSCILQGRQHAISAFFLATPLRLHRKNGCRFIYRPCIAAIFFPIPFAPLYLYRALGRTTRSRHRLGCLSPGRRDWRNPLESLCISMYWSRAVNLYGKKISAALLTAWPSENSSSFLPTNSVSHSRPMKPRSRHTVWTCGTPARNSGESPSMFRRPATSHTLTAPDFRAITKAFIDEKKCVDKLLLRPNAAHVRGIRLGKSEAQGTWSNQTFAVVTSLILRMKWKIIPWWGTKIRKGILSSLMWFSFRTWSDHQSTSTG